MKAKIKLLIIFLLILLPFKVFAENRDCVDDNTTYVTSLDSNFEYADFGTCAMQFKNKMDKVVFHKYSDSELEKKEFKGHQFCVVPETYATDRCDFTLLVDDGCPEGFSAFRINFQDDDENNYVGFGCRKDKEVSNEVVEKSLDVNANAEIDIFKEFSIQNSGNYICELETGADGVIASWSDQSKCILKMHDDIGIIYVNIRNSSNSTLAYRITLKNKKETHIESITDINIDYYNYVYKMPIGCSQANSLTYGGVQLCQSPAFTCPEDYSFFSLKAKMSNNVESSVYGCRKLKNSYTPDPYENKLNYSSLCANEGIKKVARIVGIILTIVKILVPLIIIIFGMFDLGKAVVASDEKAISKATASLIKRVIAGMVVYIIPIIVLGILNAIEITKGIEKENSSDFGTCTKCIFAPFDKTKCS